MLQHVRMVLFRVKVLARVPILAVAQRGIASGCTNGVYWVNGHSDFPYKSGRKAGVTLTFLGTGSGAPSSDGRGYSGALLTSHDRSNASFLFDAGEGTSRSLFSSNVFNNNFLLEGGIFISHLHGDHVFGLPAVVSMILAVRLRADGNILTDKLNRSKITQPHHVNISLNIPLPTPLRIFGPPGLHRFLSVALGMTQSVDRLSRLALEIYELVDVVGGGGRRQRALALAQAPPPRPPICPSPRPVDRPPQASPTTTSPPTQTARGLVSKPPSTPSAQHR